MACSKSRSHLVVTQGLERGSLTSNTGLCSADRPISVAPYLFQQLLRFWKENYHKFLVTHLANTSSTSGLQSGSWFKRMRHRQCGEYAGGHGNCGATPTAVTGPRDHLSSACSRCCGLLTSPRCSLQRDRPGSCFSTLDAYLIPSTLNVISKATRPSPSSFLVPGWKDSYAFNHFQRHTQMLIENSC